MNQYICHFDGATNPNPGPIGLGVVVFDENGEEVLSASGSGGVGSNNEGEYKALLWAMQLLLESGVENVIFKGDSKLVIQQVLGHWNVNANGLMAYHNKAQELGQQFRYCNLEWIPREQNGRADALSKIGSKNEAPVIVNNLPSNPLSNAPTIPSKRKSSEPNYSCAEQKKRTVKVKGLKGNKIAFIYSNEVVVLDVSTMHCSCSEFALEGKCEHTDIMKKHRAS